MYQSEEKLEDLNKIENIQGSINNQFVKVVVLANELYHPKFSIRKNRILTHHETTKLFKFPRIRDQ